MESVEYATLEWVEWFNNQTILQPIDDMPQEEFEKEYYAKQKALVEGAVLKEKCL